MNAEQRAVTVAALKLGIAAGPITGVEPIKAALLLRFKSGYAMEIFDARQVLDEERWMEFYGRESDYIGDELRDLAILEDGYEKRGRLIAESASVRVSTSAKLLMLRFYNCYADRRSSGFEIAAREWVRVIDDPV